MGKSIAAINTIAGTIGEISSTSGSIASAVDQIATTQRDRAQRLACGLRHRPGLDQLVRADRKATDTGAAVSAVLQSARGLTEASQHLRAELDSFMANVAAA